MSKRPPTEAEILEYMTLHNADEVGIDNQWDFEDAKYHLELDDEHYEAECYLCDSVLENGYCKNTGCEEFTPSKVE